MSKKKTRSFKDFLASEGEFKVRTIALKYANSLDDVTIEEIAKENNLSSYGVQQLFEYAIIHLIVTYQEAMSMKAKAHRNQMRHMDEEHITSSDKKYAKTFEKRLDFIRNEIDDDKVRHVTNVYLTSANIPAKTIAKSLGLSVLELNLIIKKAIIADIIDDNKLKELTELTLKKVNDSLKKEKVYNTLKNFEKKRARFKNVSAELVELYLKLEFSEDFDEAADLIDIRQRIDTLEEEYFNFFKNL